MRCTADSDADRLPAARRRAAGAPRRRPRRPARREPLVRSVALGVSLVDVRREPRAVGAVRPGERRLPVRRAARVAAGLRHLVSRRRRRHQPAPRRADDVPDADRAAVVVGVGRQERASEFSFFMLALEAAMIGVFVSLDLFLFYVFWDAMLIPMYFLIGIWGYDRRIYAAIKFILYTMAGSVLMLIAIIWLAYYAPVGRPACRASTWSISTTLEHPARRLQTLAVPGVRARVRDQGAAVPVPHLAARRARRGADGRLGHPGRRAAEDGHLRPAAVRVPAVPGGGARRSRRSSRCWRSSASSTARWSRWCSPT